MPVTTEIAFDEGVKWISFERDLPAFLKYHKEGALTLRQWLVSITTGRRDYAVFAWDDPVPFILSPFHFVYNRVRSRL